MDNNVVLMLLIAVLAVLVLGYVVYMLLQKPLQKPQQKEGFEAAPSDVDEKDYSIYSTVIKAYAKALDRAPSTKELFYQFERIKDGLTPDSLVEELFTNVTRNGAMVEPMLGDDAVNPGPSPDRSSVTNPTPALIPGGDTQVDPTLEISKAAMSGTVLTPVSDTAKASGDTPTAPSKESVVSTANAVNKASAEAIENKKTEKFDEARNKPTQHSQQPHHPEHPHPGPHKPHHPEHPHPGPHKPHHPEHPHSGPHKLHHPEHPHPDAHKPHQHPQPHSDSHIPTQHSQMHMQPHTPHHESNDTTTTTTIQTNPNGTTIVYERPTIYNYYVQTTDGAVESRTVLPSKPSMVSQTKANLDTNVGVPKSDPADRKSYMIADPADTPAKPKILNKDAAAAGLDLRDTDLQGAYNQSRNMNELRYGCQRSSKYTNADDNMKLFPEYAWSVPQERPPVCISSAKNSVSPLTEQTALTGTLLSDVKKNAPA